LLSACENPSILFKKQQFSGINSEFEIPEKWRGSWKNADGLDSSSYISKDSFLIDEFRYKIVDTNMFNENITFSEEDDWKSEIPKDKIIFQDNWCFLSKYEIVDSAAKCEGYEIFVANIDKKGDIKCWDISYEYFLKHRLINEIPILSFSKETTSNKDNTAIQTLQKNILYVPLFPEFKPAYYRRLVRNLPFTTDMPSFCVNSYDINFFKKVTKFQKPTVILMKNKEIKKVKSSFYDHRIKKRAQKIQLKKQFHFLVKE